MIVYQMNSDLSVASESHSIPMCENTRSNSVSSMSSNESFTYTREKSNQDKQNTEDRVEGEMIRKKAMQQLLWKKTRTDSVDSQEVTPRQTIQPLQNVNIRERDMDKTPARRHTPTIVSIQKMVDTRVDISDSTKHK
jgi:hypothetical protein